ncbi:type II toxin-antitoxin system RatA family toxin [Pseudohongiella nitratireducens]|uniref:type II toxin-antitoxin system RatA family toxin n=1 Tax=Pseudohongiella nitratireducens TaxID=1768907 RepID=UPI0030EDCCA3|tara:strand:- start:6033 stop:6464 length:432 start_codon:yes stop_codon:yes gene_type:complete
MVTIERSALVEYSAVQMFALVNDIEHYPEFMQGCINAEVLERTDALLTGRLTLGKAGLKYSFTTQNQLEAPTAMYMTLLDGPFRHFDATWRFRPLSDTACKVSLDMKFDWAGGMLGAAMEKLFQHSANNLVDALVERARKVYG